jgi:hypothetical protein
MLEGPDSSDDDSKDKKDTRSQHGTRASRRRKPRTIALSDMGVERWDVSSQESKQVDKNSRHGIQRIVKPASISKRQEDPGVRRTSPADNRGDKPEPGSVMGVGAGAIRLDDKRDVGDSRSQSEAQEAMRVQKQLYELFPELSMEGTGGMYQQLAPESI